MSCELIVDRLSYVRGIISEKVTSKTKASDESTASKEGRMPKKKSLSGTPSASNASVNVEE
jgi:hypothetical protein